MCKAPKPPKPKEPKKPQFLRNRYLDEFIGDSQAVNALRTGRNTLRIPMGSGTQGNRAIGTALPQPRSTSNLPSGSGGGGGSTPSPQLSIQQRLIKSPALLL